MFYFTTRFTPSSLAKRTNNAFLTYLATERKVSVDPRSGVERRRHLHESVVQESVQRAVKRAGVMKRASCHTFRHSFAAHLLEDGYDIRTVQTLLSHKNLRTTMIYTHVMQRSTAARSPLEGLGTHSSTNSRCPVGSCKA